MCYRSNRTLDSSNLWEPYEFKALTAIDTVTNLVEIIRVDDKELKTVVLNTLISNPDTRYISKHPSYLLLGITKHLLMIAHKISKVLITMRKNQQTSLSL
jgi:hypothetical protein